jgi:hypothetical protein
MRVVLSSVLVLMATAAQADLRITRDTGGYIDQYKTKYEQIRDRGGRVVIDGVCNSACTMVLGIVPRERICVTPREPRLPQGLLRPRHHLRRQGYQQGGDIRADVDLSTGGEGLAEQAGRAHERDQAAEKRRGIVEDRQSVPRGILGAGLV